jgi:hypothetical protein
MTPGTARRGLLAWSYGGLVLLSGVAVVFLISRLV